MGTEVFFAAIAKPDSKILRDLILLLGRQLIVIHNRLFPFAATSGVAVSFPVIARDPDATADLLHELLALQRLLAFGRHSNYFGSAKTTKLPPDGRPDLPPPAEMATYCRPFTM